MLDVWLLSMFGKYTSCRQWDYEKWHVSGLVHWNFQVSGEETGGQGKHLVMMVLPTMAVMSTDATENKRDNLACMGSKTKDSERRMHSLGGVLQAVQISCSTRAA